MTKVKLLNKRQFEQVLLKDLLPTDKISARIYREETFDDAGTVHVLTLYYINDVHAATWSKTQNHIFPKQKAAV